MNEGGNKIIDNKLAFGVKVLEKRRQDMARNANYRYTALLLTLQDIFMKSEKYLVMIKTMERTMHYLKTGIQV